ncbi:hypothetical protein EHW64_13710 [Erwinia psidii]|uniref:hypothetical protein n=1 Tax=Erwinia psidii TaxID=69224 RepID=UPI00226B75BC|nr:hypothetical protein [Erwinia psidii]MCX8962159.1 hypothetical protein [Erwinia psidii]
MKTELIGMKSFRLLAASGGVTEFVIQRHNDAWHLFAVNHDAGIAFFLQERRGDYKSWISLDRAATWLFSIGVTHFTVGINEEICKWKQERRD